MPLNEGKRKLYYISAEFLIGKLLSNNLIDLGLFDDVREQLADAGHDLGAIEELEVEPSLGNGGLGRLAACFLDSIATLGLPGDGVGLNYHYSLFHQRFVDNQQAALPDEWLAEQGWLVPESRSYTVEFGDFSVTSRLYDIDVPGYGQPAKNRLRLFDLVGVDDGLVPAGSIDFDKTALAKNLTLFLYPDDSDADGRLLRIYQQYFMVSNAAQLIIDEALEKWPLANLQKVAPRMAEVIVKLDAIAKSEHDDPRVAIIDGDDVAHMAHIDIHFGTASTASPRSTPRSSSRPSCAPSMTSTRRKSRTRPTASPSATGSWARTPSSRSWWTTSLALTGAARATSPGS